MESNKPPQPPSEGPKPGDDARDANQGAPEGASISQGPTVEDASTQPSPGAAVPEKHLGPYRILEQLGVGGMGTVYKAEQREPVKRIVAIKRIKPGFDTAAVIARFESERQALARMDHAHIAKVLDAGTDKYGRPYFVMEYVPGVPIVDFADKNRLSIAQRLELFLQVCEAIAHAHTKALIHRDIKSTNVLAYMADGKPFVKVIDFGVAKAVSGEKLTDRTLNTHIGAVIGTYGYMSPEQASGSADIDTRTDVYSLGVLLYELLAGAQPFDAKRLRQAAEEEIQRIIREEEPPRPSTKLSSLGEGAETVAKARQMSASTLRHELTSELDWIPLMALRKERERRYASALELADDIKNYLGHRPLRARPDSVWYRTRKMVRRNRAVLAMATGCTVFALIMLVLVLWRVSLERARVSEERGRKEVAEALAREQSARVKSFQDALDRTRSRALTLDTLASEAERSVREANASVDMGAMERKSELLAIRADKARREVRAIEDALSGFMALGNQSPSGSLPEDPSRPDISGSSAMSVMALVEQPRKIPGVRAWSIDTLGPRKGVNQVSIGPDSKRLVTAGWDGAVRICDVQTGSQLACLLGHESGVTCAVWSPDGLTIASGSEDGSVRLWRTDNFSLLGVLEGHTTSVRSVSWSPDGKMLASSSYDKTIRVWDVAARRSARVLDGHTDGISAVAWAPRGDRIASATDPVQTQDRTVRVWDARTGSEITRFFYKNPTTTQFVSLAWSTDGETLAWSDRTMVHLWHAADGRDEPIQTPPNDSGDSPPEWAVSGDQPFLDWSADQQALLLSESKRWYGSRVVIRNLKTGASLTPPVPYSSGQRAAISRDGNSLVIANKDGDLRIFDIRSRKMRREIPVQVVGVLASALSPDGKSIAIGTSGGVFETWNIQTGERTFHQDGDSRFMTVISTIDWSPNGRQLAISGYTSLDFMIQDGAIGKWSKHEPNVGAIHRLRWSPDQSCIALGAGMGPALYFPADRKVLRLNAPNVEVRSIAWSPDGKLLASANVKGDIHVWRPLAADPVAVLLGHEGRFVTLAWSPDGKTLGSAADDKTIRLWDVAAGKQILIIRGHRDRVRSIQWSNDGRELVTSGLAGTERRWAVPWGTPLSASEHVIRGVEPIAKPGGTRVGYFGTDGTTVNDRTIRFNDGAAVVIGPTGHYRGTPGVEQRLVFVVEIENRQEQLTPEQFAARYQWKNDPAKATGDGLIPAGSIHAP